MAERRPAVAIVGGGIAGLTAAWTLAKRGVPFVLLEASPRFGGVIRTESAGGFLLEAGPDSILALKPEGVALCRELGLAERLIPTHPEKRAVYVLHRRRLHALPEGMQLGVPTRIAPFVSSRLFSWRGKLRMALEVLIPARRDSKDESIAGFLRRRFGSEAVARLGEPLLAGIHAGDPERLSIAATFPRFVALEARHGSLIRGLRAARRPSAAPAAAFVSLESGLEGLVAALVDRLPAPALRTRAAARAVTRTESGFAVALDGGERVAAGAVILALPAPRAAALLRPWLEPVAATLAGLRFASSATVALGYRREDVAHPLDGYGLVVPATEGLRSAALSFVSTKFPGRAPAGHVLLRGFVGGTRDPGVLDLGDAALIDLVRDEMRGALGLRGDPVLARVYRWPEATPQMEVGHAARIEAVERGLEQVPGLALCGAGLRGVGIPDVVADATRAAERAAQLYSREEARCAVQS